MTAAQEQGSNCLILNVNDTDGVRYMTTVILRRAGFRVIEARTGREALAQIETHCPDLVVLDVKLPDMTGFDVCRLVRQNPPPHAVKILHTSATYVALENKIQSLENGADGYLMQPFEPEELVATVRSLLRLNDAETELRASAERLLEADRRKDEFLGMLAHELRNPLAAIAASLPLMERKPPQDHLEARAREVLHRQLVHLRHLVDDLLDTARVTQGRIQLQRERIDLCELVRRVVPVMESTRTAPRNQTLVISLPQDAALVDGDAIRLEQVLVNLIDNASKYTSLGGRIEVVVSMRPGGSSDAGPTHGQARLIVRDNGQGIHPDALSSIFGLFVQSEVTAARSKGGLGIGLTLVRSLVELHGGAVSARSAGTDQGSEFEVLLPLAAQRERLSDHGAPDKSAAPTRAHQRVLLVEDNEDLQEMFRGVLEMMGHEVLCADDGPSGVQLALSERPDVAFVDIGLPVLDGYEVARRIRMEEAGQDIRLIALSGYGSPEQKAKAYEAGFENHLVKPVDIERIASILQARERACA